MLFNNPTIEKRTVHVKTQKTLRHMVISDIYMKIQIDYIAINFLRKLIGFAGSCALHCTAHCTSKKRIWIYLKVKSSLLQVKIYMNLSPIKYILFYSPPRKISNKLGNYLKKGCFQQHQQKGCKFSFSYMTMVIRKNNES